MGSEVDGRRVGNTTKVCLTCQHRLDDLFIVQVKKGAPVQTLIYICPRIYIMPFDKSCLHATISFEQGLVVIVFETLAIVTRLLYKATMGGTRTDKKKEYIETSKKSKSPLMTVNST